MRIDLAASPMSMTWRSLRSLSRTNRRCPSGVGVTCFAAAAIVVGDARFADRDCRDEFPLRDIKHGNRAPPCTRLNARAVRGEGQDVGTARRTSGQRRLDCFAALRSIPPQLVGDVAARTHSLPSASDDHAVRRHELAKWDDVREFVADQINHKNLVVGIFIGPINTVAVQGTKAVLWSGAMAEFAAHKVPVRQSHRSRAELVPREADAVTADLVEGIKPVSSGSHCCCCVGQIACFPRINNARPAQNATHRMA